MLIEIKALNYVYKPGSPYETIALSDVSLSIAKGEYLGIIGHTGCGKSTLVQHMNGLFLPTSGEIMIDGIRYSEKKRPNKALRRKVGMVFQYPEDQLFEETIYDDVAFAPRNFGLGEEKTRERVQAALETVGLNYEELKDRSPFSLSGGQMRKVAIAGVLAADPQILILDEPTAGLDPKGRDEILERIDQLHRERDITVILVSHSMDDIAAHASRVIVMNNGSIAMDGTPREIFGQGASLEDWGLGTPSVSQLMQRLREKGINVRKDVLTLAEAEEEIWRWKTGGK